MDIVVDPELKAYIDPLTAEEHEALERSLLSEGCRDALVLWGEVLVDGHNRYEICRRHGLPFRTVQHEGFRSMEDVHLWMIDQHLGRRSVSDFQRGVLALRKREIVAQRRSRTIDASRTEDASTPPMPQGTSNGTARSSEEIVAARAAQDALDTREALARAARLSSNQVVLIEKIQKQAAPEVVAAVKSGALSINAAAAVASLPVQEQQAVAAAGPDELRLAARRVREARRKPATTAGANEPAENLLESVNPPPATDPAQQALLESLQRRVSELEAENARLRAQLDRVERLDRPEGDHGPEGPGRLGSRPAQEDDAVPWE